MSDISKQYASSLEEDARWLTEYAQGKKDCQRLIEITTTMYRAAWALGKMPSAQPEQRWIPCAEKLPETTYPVNITWVNHNPETYYADIKDKPFTATGCCCDGKWYWYSVVCQDYLDEYRYCAVDSMDDEIEVIAWMPLPEPWKGVE